MIPFSVCISVYRNDNAPHFIEALHSISTNQTVKPNEIILVVDGPIGNDIENAISQLTKEFSNLKIIRLQKNSGHAIARQTAVSASTTEIIAFMDSDDIALPNRFEKQLNYFETHPQTDVLGGQITEFINQTDNVVGKRVVPLTDSEIKTYLKQRCPMNFVTIMIKKTALNKVGGIIDWFCEEDYYLWIRMALANCVFANLQATLVNVRVGEEMYKRRGGWRYFKSEKDIQTFMLKHNIITLPRYIYNVCGRFFIQVLMPNSFRSFIFQKLFRK